MQVYGLCLSVGVGKQAKRMKKMYVQVIFRYLNLISYKT